MSHNIEAALGEHRVMASLAEEYGLRCQELRYGIHLVLLPYSFRRALKNSLATASQEETLMRTLNPALNAVLCNASEQGPVGYVETSYFGGGGEQGGAYYFGGSRLFATSDRPFRAAAEQLILPEAPLNWVLRLLGARRENLHDEFESVGLSQIRSVP